MENTYTTTSTIHGLYGRPTTWEDEDGKPDERELFICVVTADKKARGKDISEVSTLLTDAANKEEAKIMALAAFEERYPANEWTLHVIVQGYRVSDIEGMIGELKVSNENSILDSDVLL